MPIVVQCSGCGSKFRAPDEAAGKRVKCPKCSAMIEVKSGQPQQPAHPHVTAEIGSRAAPAVPAKAAPVSDRIGTGGSSRVLAWASCGGGAITILLIIVLLWFFNRSKLTTDGARVATTGTAPSTTPTSLKERAPDASPGRTAKATTGEAASTARESAEKPNPDYPATRRKTNGGRTTQDSPPKGVREKSKSADAPQPKPKPGTDPVFETPFGYYFDCVLVLIGCKLFCKQSFR